MLAILRTLLLLWLLRQAFRLLRVLLIVAVLVVLWPVTGTAAAAAAAAWALGWPPARLYRAAARAAPMTAVYAVAAALRYRAWRAVALAPVTSWQQASGLLLHGRVLQAVLITAPVAVPAGLAVGGAVWAWRTAAVAAGTAGRHAFAPAVFDARQWRRQARAARGLLAAPGAVPLVTSAGTVPAGAVIRAVGRRWTPVLAVPAGWFARHMVIIGASGTGKTNLMIRLWAGWYAAALTASRHGKPRPLLAALDCKGGPDARAKADRTRRVLRGVGARRIAIWPDEASVSLWTLPPRDLAVLLHQMTEHGDGAAAYYADVTQAVLTMAVLRARRPAGQRTAVPRPAGPGLAGRRLRHRAARRADRAARRPLPPGGHPAPLLHPAVPPRPGARRPRPPRGRRRLVLHPRRHQRTDRSPKRRRWRSPN